MAFLIGRLWRGSLADYGVAHWQIMAWLIGRLWRGSLVDYGVAHRQIMPWLIGRLWRSSLADYGVAHIGRIWRGSLAGFGVAQWQGPTKLFGLAAQSCNPSTLVSSTAIFAYYVNIC